ncbi:MAG: hypothetical protein AAGC73_09785 [Verrucomicrobiota bacterium]
MQKSSALFLLLTALLFNGCANSGGGSMSSQNIGILTGAILGGIAGSQMGDGDDINIAAGAVLGGMIGGAAGGQVDKRREDLEAAEAQRQYEYEVEVRKQQELEKEMEALEAQKVTDRIANTATDEDVKAAEREAARVEADLASKQKAFEESQARAKAIQDAQARIAEAQRELEELEARQAQAEAAGN